MANNVTKTRELLGTFIECAGRVRNHRVLASSNLPPHKQAKFDRLLTQTIIKHRNAKSAFEAAYRKLNWSERLDLDTLERDGDAKS